MEKAVSFKDIIKQSSNCRDNEYLTYFFKNIAQIKNQTPIYERLTNEFDVRVSIIKDSTSRVLENDRGKLMERSWRNCVFFFVDKKTYKSYFGTNDYSPNYKINNHEVYFDGTSSQSNSKFPNEPKIHWDIIKGFQDTMFSYYKKEHSSWFVRSYVYFVMVLCDEDTEISDKDFYIYYWNTNYAFKRIQSKKNIFNNVANSYFVKNVANEIKLIETSNRDVLDCVKAFSGELDFRNQTEENYLDISSDLDAGINYILIQGAARTGKTIIAMRILGNYKDSVFLIMNYNFYIALKDAFKVLEIPFPQKRIYHHDLKNRSNGGWISNLQTKQIVPNIEFLIVDEAQRLADVPEYINYEEGYCLPGIDEIDTVLNCIGQKHTILLGDDLQKLNPDYDDGFTKIYDSIKDKSFREYYFKNTIGIPSEILDNIKYLLDLPNGGQVQPTYEFAFNIVKSTNDFVELFDSDKTIKKHFVSVGLKQVKGQKINSDLRTVIEYPQSLKDADYPYFFNEEVKSKYLLSTYEVISREIESVYLYLPKLITYDIESKIIRFSGDKGKRSDEFLINHIYTLMTRATLKLTIYCEDENLNSHLTEKINYISLINQDATEDNSRDEQGNYNNDSELDQGFDYDIFIAYHGTFDPKGSYQKAKEICDYLVANKIRVFLNGYSFNQLDADLGFNETRNVIQRSNKFLLVFNDNIYRDKYGMIPRKYSDNKVNQLYSELTMLTSLVDDDQRTNKNHLKFFYDGNKYNRSDIYGYLNNLYRIGTTGNSNCCHFTFEEVLVYAKS